MFGTKESVPTLRISDAGTRLNACSVSESLSAAAQAATIANFSRPRWNFMSNDILIRGLRTPVDSAVENNDSTPTGSPSESRITSLSSDDIRDLANAYAAAYPPEIGAASTAEAIAEMTATFAGEYGTLRPDASHAVRSVDGTAMGAILVTERSIWDEDIEGPFIIDLFIHPDVRNEGLGLELVERAIRACVASGDDSLSLRFGEGTSPAASRIYSRLGFRAPLA